MHRLNREISTKKQQTVLTVSTGRSSSVKHCWFSQWRWWLIIISSVQLVNLVLNCLSCYTPLSELLLLLALSVNCYWTILIFQRFVLVEQKDQITNDNDNDNDRHTEPKETLKTITQFNKDYPHREDVRPEHNMWCQGWLMADCLCVKVVIWCQKHAKP